MTATTSDLDKQATQRARLSLEGLSVGDALGERFFGPTDAVVHRIEGRQMPKAPWRYTDDTEMAISVFEQLRDHGRIDQDRLAKSFAARMEDNRGYGRGAYEILCGIRQGNSWHALSYGAFGGSGSFGNGAAMRVAPLGAYFADDLDRCVKEARLQAEVTHAHEEGIAGAVAVAVAGALAWQRRGKAVVPGDFLQRVVERVPAGHTRQGIDEAINLPAGCSIVEAAQALGNGSGISAPDTVPLCLWVASQHLDSFEDAFWKTVSALGDRDTTCAIVGGIVAPGAPAASIPAEWIRCREGLPL